MSSSESVRRPLDPRLISLASKDELLRPAKIRIPAKEFIIAERRGEVRRICSGVYLGHQHPQSYWTPLAGWTVRYPDAVACLLTAARFHNLLPKPPKPDPECWVYLPSTEIRYNPTHLRVVGVPFHEIPPDPEAATDVGLEEGIAHGTPIHFTGPDRTVIDLLRYHERRSVELPKSMAQNALIARLAQPDFDLTKFSALVERLGVWKKILPLTSPILRV
jgi:hypothetical protein